MLTRLLPLVLALPLLCPATAADRPNVLFIAVDDLNDWVGFLGGHPQVRTPHMDRLAARGVTFANAHCASPLCCPSRAALFTGMQPFHTGVYQNNHDLRKAAPNLVLLPHYFQQHGYATFGTGKLLHRKRKDVCEDMFLTEQRWSPFTRKQVDYTPDELPSKGTNNPRHVVNWGPDRPEITLPLNRMPSDRAPNSKGGESFDWGPIDVSDHDMGDGKITDWAIERLDQSADKPFFMAVGFYRPHIPLFAPRKYFDLYPVNAIKLPVIAEDDMDDLGDMGRRIALEALTAGSHNTVVQHNQWREAVAGYLACVSFVDAQIGRLLDALDNSPHADNTVIVLWSDHGWHLGEKQHWGKSTGWERSTRVVLAIAPARNQRSEFKSGMTTAPVSLIDLYPTLIDLCGLPERESLDGQSLTPLLRDPLQSTGRSVVTTFQTSNFSVRSDRYRLIHYRDGSEELYDLQVDPHEFRNLAGEASVASVQSALSAMIPRHP
jgi:choline-sulfatase